MNFVFSNKDIENIAKVLGSKPEKIAESWSWHLHNPKTKQSLVFTICNKVNLGKKYKGAVISVQTHHGYYELHDCSAFLIFEPGEVIFTNANKKKVTCLIVGKQCTCSMFSNIRREILSADFSTLDPAILLSAMQLSLTESILP